MARFSLRRNSPPPAPAAEEGQEESFVSHLVELRDRMIKALLVVLLLFGVCFYFSGDIMKFLSQPLYQALPPGSKPIFTDQAGAFFTLTKVAFLTATLLSLPWIMYQAWAFVAPGLYEHEKRFALPLVVSSIFFLVVGIGFAYLFVLPAAYKFFFAFASSTGAEILQDLQKYWDFTLAIFFGFGLTFEVPVVVVVLARMGVVSIEKLKQIRPYVVVGAFVLAAVVTPPDMLSQLMLAIPLCILYELGLIAARLFVKQGHRQDEGSEGNGEATP